MNLSVDLLLTVAECDGMLEILEAEKVQIQRRLRNLGELLDDRSGTVQEVKAGIVSVEAIIGGYQAAIAVITDDKERRKLELKIEREETKLKSLQNRDANYSALSVIEDQVDHNQLDVQIGVLDTAIADVNTRKAAL